MIPRLCVWSFLCGIALLAGPGQGLGQDLKDHSRPGRGYVTIPISGDLEDMLRRQFHQARLEELLKKWHIDPKLLPALEKIDKEQEQYVQKLLEQIPKKGLSPAEREKLKEIAKGLMPSPPQGGKKPFRPQMKPANPLEENLENRFGRWVRDLMKNAENSTIGDMIQNSTAWQEGLKDFDRFLSDQEKRDFLGLGKLNLPMPRDLNIDLEQTWMKIKNLSLPGLSVTVPVPDVSIGNPLTGLRLPALPSGSLALGQAAVWILVVLGLILVVWQIARRVGRSGLAASGWRLGSWPVNPANISTRAELIAAFDYLALLCLGRQARTWNHSAIGDSLASTKPEHHLAARELASLYEWARYAPEPDALSDQALANARRDLCILAGVAAP